MFHSPATQRMASHPATASTPPSCPSRRSVPLFCLAEGPSSHPPTREGKLGETPRTPAGRGLSNPATTSFLNRDTSSENSIVRDGVFPIPKGTLGGGAWATST